MSFEDKHLIPHPLLCCRMSMSMGVELGILGMFFSELLSLITIITGLRFNYLTCLKIIH